MSEYQYYEWQTLDRSLTATEQKAVNGLSSHIDVTSTQAVVTYDPTAPGFDGFFRD